MTYNVSCINSLVVYVGSQAILQLNNKTPIITHSAPMDVFHQVRERSSASFSGGVSREAFHQVHTHEVQHTANSCLRSVT